MLNPQTAEDHIANYFENLYTAREGEEAYMNWTRAVDQQIQEIMKIKDKEQNQTINMDEINKAIRQLKKGKSNGPDNILNKALINANEGTTQIYLEIMNKIHKNGHQSSD